jgi:hypothetical protein
MKAMVFLIVLFFIQAQQLLLPEGNGAWLVQVNTTGGIAGNGAGDIAMSSEGKILCSREMKCPDGFKFSDFQPLIETFQTLVLPVPSPGTVSLCRDCITRTISVRWRDSMGIFHTYTATFDETTKGKLPPEVAKLYDAVVALRQ